MLCLLGCSAEPPPSLVLPVRLHTLPDCAPRGAAASASLTLRALGDFAASNESAEILPLDRAGTSLPFPSATQALEARLDGEPGFWGYGERGRSGLDVLLWPEQATCSLFRPDGAQGYPGAGGGQALTYLAGAHGLLAAGGNDALLSDAIVGALTFDAATGRVASFDTSESGVLQQPRAFATATVFGDYVLVAGGENPLFGVPDADIQPRDSAELFDPVSARFVGELELQYARTRHAAVALRDGRTLLVGGRGKVGATTLALRQLELLDPATNRAQIGQQLAARVEPRALLLSDGRVFVGGGTTLDGAPVVPTGEWLSATAEPERELSPDELPPRLQRAFVALPGGGVLAVGGCEAREPLDEADARTCRALCGRGCPPLGTAGAARAGLPVFDARWFSAEGEGSEVSLDGISAGQPVLLPGSDGMPWLVAASLVAPGEPRLYRFNPWSRSFSAVSAPAQPLPRPGFPQPVALGTDTFAWLDERDGQGELLGLRLGTRNRFTQDLALVLQADPLDLARPLHLVPSRALLAPEGYDGTLRLDADANPRAVVLIADTDYGDVTITIGVDPSSAPPRVRLGDAELGGEDCPWPRGSARGDDADVAVLVRTADRAELRFRGERSLCGAPKTRVSIGFSAGEGPAVITRIDVRRGAERPGGARAF